MGLNSALASPNATKESKNQMQLNAACVGRPRVIHEFLNLVTKFTHQSSVRAGENVCGWHIQHYGGRRMLFSVVAVEL